MAEAKATIGINMGGVTRSKTITRDADTDVRSAVPLVGVSGTLSARTDGDTGVVTATAHGITDSYRVDLGWAESGVNKHRANMAISSVPDANTINVTGGNGDWLPVVDTAVIVGPRTSINHSSDGSDITLISLHSEPASDGADSRAMVDFMGAADTSYWPCDLNDNEPFVWASNSPVSNRLDGYTITSLEVSSLAAGEQPTVSIEITHEAD